MDVGALARVAHERGALFHTDATQALGKMPLDVKGWNVDALSLSAHKVGGPKGVGALYLKARTPFSAQMVGGGQESAKRSGTQNVCGVCGFAAAARQAVAELASEPARLRKLRDRCYRALLDNPRVEASVPWKEGDLRYAPHIVNVLVEGMESETLILDLDNRGVCVSGGSACSSHSLDPSHVLSALGIERKKALGSLRISLGRLTTDEDIDRFVAIFDSIVR